MVDDKLDSEIQLLLFSIIVVLVQFSLTFKTPYVHQMNILSYKKLHSFFQGYGSKQNYGTMPVKKKQGAIRND
ncbi:MAG TPA: hypothetical protein DIT14_05940 [Enterococcus faecalis]|nr:hypothetical protein [Enterococcus faecalis]